MRAKWFTIFLLILLALSQAKARAGDTSTGEGLRPELRSAEVAGLQQWINQTRLALVTTISRLASMNVADAHATLLQTFTLILQQHEPRAENTLAYYSLARAYKAEKILQSSNIDLRLSILWAAAEIALDEIQLHGTARSRASFGVDYSLFLMAKAEDVLNIDSQNELMRFALGLLSVDLTGDPASTQFAEAELHLIKFLDQNSKSQPRSSAERLSAIRDARQAYQNCLAALKGTVLATEVAGTENPTIEYNRRVLRKSLSSVEADIQAASMEKLIALRASTDDLQRILLKLGDPSLTTCTAAYIALKNQPSFPDSLIPIMVSDIRTNAAPRTCRYAAILLSQKFDRTMRFEPLRQMTKSVVGTKNGIWYPEGRDGMVLPVELNFVMQMALFGPSPYLPDIKNFCSSTLCVGDWVIVRGLFNNIYGPVTQVDQQDRIQLYGKPDKWIEPNYYSRRVERLDSFSTGSLALKKSANSAQHMIAKMLVENPNDPDAKYRANVYLQRYLGIIDHIFENGEVILHDAGLIDFEWDSRISELEMLR